MRSFIIAVVAACAAAEDIPDPWAGMTDEQLYANARDDMADIVRRWDRDGNERVTAREFLEEFENPNAESLANAKDPDFKWWENGEFLNDAVMPATDGDKDGVVKLDELSTLLMELTYGVQAEDLYKMYAKEPANGLQRQELTALLQDWSGADFRKVPDWFDSDKDLFEGMNPLLKPYVLSFDVNGDGFTHLRELLNAANYPEVDAVIDTHGEDAIWWWGGDVIAKVLMHLHDFDHDGLITAEALRPTLTMLGVDAADVQLVFNAYSEKPKQGMKESELGVLMNELFWGRPLNKEHTKPDWFDWDTEDIYYTCRQAVLDFIFYHDIDNDEKVTYRQFMDFVNISPERKESALANEQWKVQWWTSGHYIVDAYLAAGIEDAGTMLENWTKDQLHDFLEIMKMEQFTDGVFYTYNNEDKEIITRDQLTNFVDDWIKDTMDPNIYEWYDWFFWTDEELYGGLRDNIKHLVLLSDVSGNGRTTATEFLNAIGCKTTDQLIADYGPGYLWWRDEAFLTAAILGSVDHNLDGSITDAELVTLFMHLQYSGEEANVIQAYAADKTATGLNDQELERFLHDWLRDKVLPPVWPPNWRFESDEYLYGGMNEYIQEWVESFDTHNVGYTSLHMMMKHLGWTDVRIWDLYGTDYNNLMWWKYGKDMAYLFMPEVDQDGNDHVDLAELQTLMTTILDLPAAYHHLIDEAYEKYASDEALGLTFEELSAVLEEWAYGVLNPVFQERPYWYDWSDEQLYGGHRANLKDLVLHFDHNQDGRVTITEYLTAVNSGIKDQLLEVHGWEKIWWTDAGLITDVLLDLFDVNTDLQMSRDELMPVLDALNMKDKIDYVMYYYAENAATTDSMLASELEKFISDYIKDMLAEDEWGTPWWIFLDEDTLYDGLNERLRYFVRKFDQNSDDRATIMEFLTTIDHQDKDSVIQAQGIDSRWWTHQVSYKIYVETVHKDALAASNGFISEITLVEILQAIELSADAKWLYQAYAQQPTKGITADEIATIFYDWAYYQLRANPYAESFWWFHITDSELYSGFFSDFESRVLQADLNNDGFTTIREMLTAINHPHIHDLLAKYGADHMWFHDGEFYDDCFIKWADADMNGSVDDKELAGIVASLSIPFTADQIIMEYAYDLTAMTSVEFANFFWDWAHNELENLNKVHFDQAVVAELYSKFVAFRGTGQELKGEIGLMDGTLGTIQENMTTLITPQN